MGTVAVVSVVVVVAVASGTGAGVGAGVVAGTVVVVVVVPLSAESFLEQAFKESRQSPAIAANAMCFFMAYHFL